MTYLELKAKQEQELNSFPMIFAFSEKQLKEAMKDLELKEDETDQLSMIGSGGFIRTSDSKRFSEMLERFNKETQEAIDNDQTGEGFIKDMFRYELSNHEYCITFDLQPTLDALGLTIDEVLKSEQLTHGLELAKAEYLEAVGV